MKSLLATLGVSTTPSTHSTPPLSKRLRSIIGPPENPVSPMGPESVEIEARRLRLGGLCASSFAVVGYPREVGPGWMEPLVSYAGRADVSLHIEPVPAQIAAQRLRRQMARLESQRRADTAKERLVDPHVEVAAHDAQDLATRIARGEGKLFRVGLYVTVYATDNAELAGECARLRSLCSSMLVDPVASTWRALQGWVTTLPLGVDQLGQRRSFDTAALSCAYPFSSSPFASPTGILYGTTSKGSGLVFWDRFDQHNYNEVILAASGAGKSYLAKLSILRHLYRGIEVCVIDPENEYERLCGAVGGTYISLGTPGVRINPFDLGPSDDRLIDRALFIHSLVAVLVGESLTSSEKAALDRAILAAYETCGITSDPATHDRPAPVLADLSDALAAHGDEASVSIAHRLSPFVSGTHRKLFDGPTTTRPCGHLVVYSLRDLPDELKAAGTLLVLDTIWNTVSAPALRRRREIVVDEAYLLMAQAEGAKFLYRLAKSARKYWCALTVITQDAGDLLGTDLGHAVVANAATQILLRQAPQSIDALAESFHLSAGERAYLLGARRGDALLVAGTERVAFTSLASPAEHDLVTTDPAELAGN